MGLVFFSSKFLSIHMSNTRKMGLYFGEKIPKGHFCQNDPLNGVGVSKAQSAHSRPNQICMSTPQVRGTNTSLHIMQVSPRANAIYYLKLCYLPVKKFELYPSYTQIP